MLFVQNSFINNAVRTATSNGTGQSNSFLGNALSLKNAPLALNAFLSLGMFTDGINNALKKKEAGSLSSAMSDDENPIPRAVLNGISWEHFYAGMIDMTAGAVSLGALWANRKNPLAQVFLLLPFNAALNFMRGQLKNLLGIDPNKTEVLRLPQIYNSAAEKESSAPPIDNNPAQQAPSQAAPAAEAPMPNTGTGGGAGNGMPNINAYGGNAAAQCTGGPCGCGRGCNSSQASVTPQPINYYYTWNKNGGDITKENNSSPSTQTSDDDSSYLPPAAPAANNAVPFTRQQQPAANNIVPYGVSQPVGGAIPR